MASLLGTLLPGAIQSGLHAFLPDVFGSQVQYPPQQDNYRGALLAGMPVNKQPTGPQQQEDASPNGIFKTNWQDYF
jgi:hypothetical protein